MKGANDLASMVPGFDFLQGLFKNAGAGLPSMGQWIAPTLNPEELDKRIQELKTVQFWLEQNARLLSTTIQALEVQRMTLSTLQTMNLPLADLAESLKIRPPSPPPRAAAPEPEPEPEPDLDPEAGPETEPEPEPPAPTRRTAAAGQPAAPAVDPMQWWSALTQQFTELATQAVKDTAADSTRAMSGGAAKKVAATPRQAPAPKPSPESRSAKPGQAAKAAKAAKVPNPAPKPARSARPGPAASAPRKRAR